jgi:hypothetical protein
VGFAGLPVLPVLPAERHHRPDHQRPADLPHRPERDDVHRAAVHVGIAFAFGKASVFKYISDDYPDNIGVISGVVGLAGGLGGFVMPIMFGAWST